MLRDITAIILTGQRTDSEGCARQMVFYLSHFAGASPNNSQMSHLITRPASYVAARSLARHATPVPLPRVIFFANARVRKDTEETLAIEYHGESRLAPSSWPAVCLVIFQLHDQFPGWRKRQTNAACRFRAYDESRRENVALVRCAHLPSREDNKTELITDNRSELNGSRDENLWIWRETLSRCGIDAKGKMNHRVWCHDSTSQGTRLISFALGNAHTQSPTDTISFTARKLSVKLIKTFAERVAPRFAKKQSKPSTPDNAMGIYINMWAADATKMTSHVCTIK